MIEFSRTRLVAIPALLITLTAATLVLADTVADSVEDFSGTQGLNGWTYGYWNESEDADGTYDQAADFRLFSSFGKGIWGQVEDSMTPRFRTRHSADSAARLR